MTDRCKSCGEVLGPSMRACPSCGRVASPASARSISEAVPPTGGQEASSPGVTAFCTGCRKPVPVGVLLCDECTQGAIAQAPSPPTPDFTRTRAGGLGAEAQSAAAGKGDPAPVGSRSAGSIALSRSVITSERQSAFRDGFVVVVGLYAVSLIVALVALPLLHGARAADVLRGAGWLTGLTVRGHLIATGAVGGSASGAVDAYVQPGLLFAGLVAAIAILTRRAERRAPSASMGDVAASSVASGLGAGIAALVVALATGGTVGGNSGGGPTDVHVNAVSALIGALVFVGLAAAVARLATSWRRPLLSEAPHRFIDQWWPEVRSIGALGAVGAPLGFVAIVLALVIGGAPAGAWLIALLDLPFLLAEVVLLSFGVPLSTSGSFSAGGIFGGSGTLSVGVFGGGLPGYFWLLLLVPVLGVIGAGIRTTVSAPMSEAPPWSRAWRTAVIGAIAAWIVTFITSINAGGGAGVSVLSGSATARIGMAVFGSLVAGAVVGACVPLVGFYATRYAARRAPGLVVSVGTIGRGTLHAEWAATLGDSDPAHLTRVNPSPWPRPEESFSSPAVASTFEGRSETPEALSRAAFSGPRRQFRLTRKTKIALGSLVGVIVLLVAALVAVNLASSSYTPTAIATSYLQAVASGNASGALTETDGQWHGSLLSSAALRAQDAADPITHIHVGAGTTSGSVATVTASYWVGNTPESNIPITLRRAGSKDLFFTNWQIVDPVARVSVGQGAVTLDGTVSDRAGQTVLAFPGRLVLQATSSRNPYFRTTLAGGGSEVVAPGSSVQLSTTTRLTSGGATAVLGAVDQSLQQCLNSTSLAPPNCPFSDQSALSANLAQVSGVQWSVSTMPTAQNTTLSLKPNGSVQVAADYGAVSVSCSYNYVDPVFGPQSTSDTDIVSMTDATVTLVPGQASAVSFQNFQ